MPPRRINPPKETWVNDIASPEDIKAARTYVKLSATEAGRLVYVSRSVWESYEYPESHHLHRVMHPALSELFALKTGLLTIEEANPTLAIIKEMTEKQLWRLKD